MSPKIFFLLLAVTLCGLVSGEGLVKKLQKQQFVSKSFADANTKKNLQNLIRRRREAVENSTSDESLDEEDYAKLAKFFIAVAWNTNKLEILSDILESVSDTDNNITIIGWQRIVGDDGNVKEVNTIQLVIPPKPETETEASNVVDVDEDDDDEDDDDSDDRVLPHDEINEIREVFEPFASVGIPGSVTLESYDQDNKQTLLIYLDKDELFFKAEDFAIYNKTSVATSDEVSKFIANIKPGSLGKPTVLKYDQEGKLLLDESNIRPQLLGGVIDFYEATDDMLLKAPKIVATVSQQFARSEIPRQLAEAFNKSYPKYQWRTLTNPGEVYLTRDVTLTLTYDNFDFDENSDISWLVYGVKR